MPQCDISCPAKDFDTLTTMAESITFTRGQAATQAGAIPSSVYAVPGKGGLRLEKDLAIGRASVALANPTGAFVISAGDGVYHRLALPGYDARLYNHQRPGLALSPDGWKLAYAWHGPTRLMNPGESYDGLIQAKFRLVDLRTGRISPIEPHVPGLRSPLAWLAWNPRWSPDSRFVVSDLTLTFGDDNGIKTDWYEHNSESESSVQRLDASQERTWTAKGRFEYTGIDKPYGSVPIVKLLRRGSRRRRGREAAHVAARRQAPRRHPRLRCLVGRAVLGRRQLAAPPAPRAWRLAARRGPGDVHND